MCAHTINLYRLYYIYTHFMHAYCVCTIYVHIYAITMYELYYTYICTLYIHFSVYTIYVFICVYMPFMYMGYTIHTHLIHTLCVCICICVCTHVLVYFETGSDVFQAGFGTYNIATHDLEHPASASQMLELPVYVTMPRFCCAPQHSVYEPKTPCMLDRRSIN